MASFESWVPALGFRWIDAPPGSPTHDPEGQSERWLFPAGGESFPLSGRSYDPTHTDLALFRIFANLEHSEAAFLDFANQYGYLGEGEPIMGTTHDLTHPATIGEPLGSWGRQVAVLADTLDLWDMLSARSVDRLNQLLKVVEEPDRRALLWAAPRQTSLPLGRRRSGPVVLYDTARGSEHYARASVVRWRLGGPISPDIAPEDVPPGDVEAAARVVVLSQLRLKLHQGLSAAIVEVAPGSDFTIEPGPGSLLSALWLAFALEVSGHRITKDCEWCQRPFQVARRRSAFDHRVGRSDKRFCSDKCGDDASNSRRRRGQKP